MTGAILIMLVLVLIAGVLALMALAGHRSDSARRKPRR